MNQKRVPNVAALPSAVAIGKDQADIIAGAHAEFGALREKIDAAVRETVASFEAEGMAIELKIKGLWETALASVGLEPNDSLAMFAQPGEQAFVVEHRELQLHLAEVDLENATAALGAQLGEIVKSDDPEPSPSSGVEQIHSPD